MSYHPCCWLCAGKDAQVATDEPDKWVCWPCLTNDRPVPYGEEDDDRESDIPAV